MGHGQRWSIVIKTVTRSTPDAVARLALMVALRVTHSEGLARRPSRIRTYGFGEQVVSWGWFSWRAAGLRCSS